MANIPVERTRGTGGVPWWAWLLGLIVLIGLIWLIASLVTNDDPDRTAPPPEDRRTAPPAQPGDPATPPQDPPGTPPPGQPGTPGTTTSILAPAGPDAAVMAQAAKANLEAAMNGNLRVHVVATNGALFATATV